MSVELNKILGETLKLPEAAKNAILEAWDSKLSEAKNILTSELREEFAQKFEHDKNVLVESMDRFLNDKIRTELEEFAQDRSHLVAQRLASKKQVKEHINLLNNFITKTIAKETKELHGDRVKMKENVKKLENFVLKQLSEEIQEFHNDKQALVEQKVKMIREGKEELTKTKSEFIKRAASLVESNINNVLRKEISQYRDDIKAARENDFGKRIFESFVGEYMTSYLNEGTEVTKLMKVIADKDRLIAETKSSVTSQAQLTESANVQLKIANEKLNRNNILSKLLSPLGKEKKAVMVELLSTVKTNRLEESFNKYLPAVLNEAIDKKPRTTRSLQESVITEKTGNRPTSVSHNEESDFAIDLQKMKSLAGIK